jgi:hypothetical protein
VKKRRKAGRSKVWTITLVSSRCEWRPTRHEGSHEEMDEIADEYRRDGHIVAVHPIDGPPRIRTATLLPRRTGRSRR